MSEGLTWRRRRRVRKQSDQALLRRGQLVQQGPPRRRPQDVQEAQEVRRVLRARLVITQVWTRGVRVTAW